MLTLIPWCGQFNRYIATDFVCSQVSNIVQLSKSATAIYSIKMNVFPMGKLSAFFRCSTCQHQWCKTAEGAPVIGSCPSCRTCNLPYSVVIRFILSFIVRRNLRSEHLFVFPSNQTMAMEPKLMKQDITAQIAETNGTTDHCIQMSLFSASGARCLLNHTHRYKRFSNGIIKFKWCFTTRS